MSNPLAILIVKGDYAAVDEIPAVTIATAWYRWGAVTEAVNRKGAKL